MVIIVFHPNKLTKLLLHVPWSCPPGGWGLTVLSKKVQGLAVKTWVRGLQVRRGPLGGSKDRDKFLTSR